MILMYHKVYPESPTCWWVTPNAFWNQMEALRRYDVVYLDDYDPSNPKHAVITFDGVYENVCTYALPILRRFGYPFELFLVGDTIGKGNEFDQPIEPPARFADPKQLGTLINHGGRLQWHSMTHRDLSQRQDFTELQNELLVPEKIKNLNPKGFRWFAYPHGKHPPQLIELAKKFFQGAVSCIEGNDHDRYQMNRITVTNETVFKHSSVSLIIPNYNYGHLAAEAIESALCQTVPPDEILFIDDCSIDNSVEIAERYRDKIKIVRNEKNLGIVDNFNKAVSLTTGDYICFLGADNRFRSDYVEKCKLILDLHEDAAIAYTDTVLFGPRAEVLAHKVGARPEPNVRDVFLWEFSDFNEDTRKTLKQRNFMHGSSMYRRAAFEQANGYMGGNEPEDHNLFVRMVEKGWNAVRVPEFLLEYRQHSREQANTQLNYSLELAYLRRQLKEALSSLSNANIKDKDDRITKLESFIGNHRQEFRLDDEGRKKKLALLHLQNEVMGNIDEIEQRQGCVEMKGWAYIKGFDSVNSKISVLFISDKNSYIFNAQSVKRLDVTAFFKTLNFDDSGYYAIIPSIILEKGEYQLFIYIETNAIQALKNANKRIVIKD